MADKTENEAEELRQRLEAQAIIETFQKRLQAIKSERASLNGRLSFGDPDVEAQAHGKPGSKPEIQAEFKGPASSASRQSALPRSRPLARALVQKAAATNMQESKGEVPVQKPELETAAEKAPHAVSKHEIAQRVHKAMVSRIEKGALTGFISGLVEDVTETTRKKFGG